MGSIFKSVLHLALFGAMRSHRVRVGRWIIWLKPADVAVLRVQLIREGCSMPLQESAFLRHCNLVIGFLLSLPIISAHVTLERMIENRRMHSRLLELFVCPFLVRRVVPRIRGSDETFLPCILTLVMLLTLGNSPLKLGFVCRIGSLRFLSHPTRLACLPSRSYRITK